MGIDGAGEAADTGCGGGLFGTNGAPAVEPSTGRCSRCDTGLSAPAVVGAKLCELVGTCCGLGGGVGRAFGGKVWIISLAGDGDFCTATGEKGGVWTWSPNCSLDGVLWAFGVVNNEEPEDVSLLKGDFVEVALSCGSSERLLRALRGVDLVWVRRRTSPEPPGLLITRSDGQAISKEFSPSGLFLGVVFSVLMCLFWIRRSLIPPELEGLANGKVFSSSCPP